MSIENWEKTPRSKGLPGFVANRIFDAYDQ
jgi:hypothetical protein